MRFMLLLNRACDVEKLQRLQNRCMCMCLDIYNPCDVSVVRLHELSNISLLNTRRQIHHCKIMFNLVQNDKYRKSEIRVTRTIGTHVFDTDIVHLGVYSNSPYYKGVKLWNDIPLEIRSIRDKCIFDYRMKRHFEMTMN